MNDIYRMLQVLNKHPHLKFAMATIIEVIGSNYRRVGAKMLFSENGYSFGTLSAGCLEEDLSHHALNVINSQRPLVVTYDLMTDDVLSWGENIGCNGKITIYIEAIEWRDVANLEQFLQNGKAILSVKCINGEQLGTTLYTAEGADLSDDSNTLLDLNPLLPDLQAFLQSDRKANLIYCDPLQSYYYIERYQSREKLYVFGAGPDAEPIVSHASRMDFDVTVIDPRENRCNTIHFPSADQLILSYPATFLENHALPKDSFVLVMTHNFKWDRMIVEHLIDHPVRYLGVLGPRRRTEALVPSSSLPEWLHSPIGLSIGAEGPEEISISIIGQLIQERNMRNAGSINLTPYIGQTTL